jgi:hypothetical protein
MTDPQTPPALLESAVEIAASAERVWTVLTDFAAYPQWNPFMIQVAGRIRRRARLTVQIALPGRPVITFKPKLKTVVRSRELRWIGGVLAPGLLDGEHSFELEPLGEGRCRLWQREHFSGVLAPLFTPALQEATRGGFEAMNQALKLRAEAG